MQKLRFINGKGVEIDFTSGRYGITEWSGFSNADLNIQSQQVPFQDGAVFLDALYNPRELSVTVAINDDNDLEKRYELKRELISAMNAKLGEGYLYYKNDYLERRIKVIPQLPVFENKNSNDSGTLKASLSWTAPEVYWEDVEETKVSIPAFDEVMVNNEGDVPCAVELELDVWNINNISIRNRTNDKKIMLEAINEAEVLRIQTEVGQKKIVMQQLDWNISMFSVALRSCIYANGKFIGVGQGSSIIISSDGISWQLLTANLSDVFFDKIIYVDELSLYIILSSDGVYISPDLITWTKTSSIIGLHGVVYSKSLNLLVAVGNRSGSGSGYSQIITSPDGVTWTSRSTSISASLLDITYSETLGLFVAVGTNKEVITSPNGINWTKRTNNSYVYNICFSESLGLFVGAGGSEFITSLDGITWESHALSLTNRVISQLIWVESLKSFVGVGGNNSNGNNGVVITSPDGFNWTIRANNIEPDLTSVCFSESLGLFVSIGGQFYHGSVILESVGGINWTRLFSYYNTDDLHSIVYSKETGKFVIGGNSVNTSFWGGYTSSDGISWTKTLSGVSLEDIIYIKPLRMFVGVCYHVSVTSPDGITWTSHLIDGSATMLTIAYSEKDELMVVAGIGNYIYTSPDGITWTRYNARFTKTINKIIYSDELELFIAVGNEGVIYTSSNGISWTSQESGVSVNLNNIIYVNEFNLLIAIGNNGTIITSADGITWTSLTTVITESLYGIAYGYNLFIVVGENGAIYISVDLITWRKIASNTAFRLTRVQYALKLNRFVIIGLNNIVFYSEIIPNINIINKLVSGSDMTFNLEPGENILNIYNTPRQLTGLLTYRQKYLGV